MSQEVFNNLMESVLKNVAMTILSLGTGEEGPKAFQGRRSGNLHYLRLQDSQGQTRLQVCGENIDELGKELVLACLQKVSIDQLRAYHKQPLKQVFEVKKGKG
jgi:hypothetical protein